MTRSYGCEHCKLMEHEYEVLDGRYDQAWKLLEGLHAAFGSLEAATGSVGERILEGNVTPQDVCVLDERVRAMKKMFEVLLEKFRDEAR